MFGMISLTRFFLRHATDAAASTLKEYLTDHTETLRQAISSANERSWRVIGLALAGKSFVSRVKSVLTPVEEKVFSKQVAEFLAWARLEKNGSDFRKACLRELDLGRRQRLIPGNVVIANLVTGFDDFSDRQGLIEEAKQAVAGVANELEGQFPNLARLAMLPTADKGPPLLVVAFSYFLRREVESDPALQRGLSFETMQKLWSNQASAWLHVENALKTFGGRLDQVLDSLQEIRDEQQRQGQTLQAIYDHVHQLLEADKLRQRQMPASAEEILRAGLHVAAGQYDASLATDNPGCVLFLVDHSKSMAAAFGRQPELRKADGVAVSINWILSNLCKEVGAEKDRLYLGVIGYQGNAAGANVSSVVDGPLAQLLRQRRARGEPELVSTRELTANPLRELRVVKKKGKPPRKVPIWVNARAEGSRTPMKEAFAHAQNMLEQFLQRHPKCFPPMVLHFTDGRPNTGDPKPEAEALRKLASENGNVLLFNAHLSDRDCDPIVFPHDVSALPQNDTFARQMFEMSSPLPNMLVVNAIEKKIRVKEGARCFAFNGDLDSVTKMLQIGTTSFTGSSSDLLKALRTLETEKGV